MSFKPQTLTVRPGDRVIWVNRDLLAHTATAADGHFDSHEVKPEASWSWVVTARGIFPYACAFHPTMTGKLVVQ